MKPALLTVMFFALVACGADGPPIRPSVSTTVTIGSDGMETSTGVILNRGNATVGAIKE